MKKALWVLLVVIILLGLWAVYRDTVKPIGHCERQPWPCGMAATGTDEIWITSPYPSGKTVSSPIYVEGFAKGTWYFEASFPITIVDWDGRIIGQGHAQAKSDWMTEKQVLFEASIPFNVPECGAGQDYCHRGAIIFRNDNPSGDPARSKSYEMQVIFK